MIPLLFLILAFSKEAKFAGVASSTVNRTFSRVRASFSSPQAMYSKYFSRMFRT